MALSSNEDIQISPLETLNRPLNKKQKSSDCVYDTLNILDNLANIKILASYSYCFWTKIGKKKTTEIQICSSRAT